MGNGGVNLEGFFGNAAFFVGWHSAKGTHIVQAIGQFDQNNPQVIGHGQCHFLEVFGLLFGLRLKFDLGELAHAVHQLGNRVAKLLGDGFFSNTGVFNYIVQHRGHQALMVHMHAA